MIDLITTRKILGPRAEHLKEKELERIRETAYGIADAIFENWLRERNAQAYVGEKPEKPP